MTIAFYPGGVELWSLLPPEAQEIVGSDPSQGVRNQDLLQIALIEIISNVVFIYQPVPTNHLF
jgi:hypothetical protein